MRTSAWLPLLLMACSAPCPRGSVVAQKELGENACGPCAFYNGLVLGDASLAEVARRLPGADAPEKIRGLIGTYGRRPSEEYGGKKPRYTEDAGMSWRDLLGLANDVYADHGLPPARGSYLDRSKGEATVDHVLRIHGLLRRSLDAGFPPLVSFRSFEARRQGEEFLWHGLFGHWVTVVEVPSSLPQNEKGFRFGYADPYTGRVEYGYVHVDEARNFTSARGNAETWEWVSDRPFCLVTAPSLRLKTQDAPWFARTLITLNYAVFRST